MTRLERTLRRVFPAPLLSWVAAQVHWARGRMKGEPFAPPRGGVRFGSLRRTTPLNRSFGGERGRPVDRYYIDRFLEPRSAAIRGTVLEFAEPLYTLRFGGEQVVRSEVLHLSDPSPPATLVADLTRLEGLPEGRFDCILCTQVLPFIYDLPAAVAGLHHMLRPGGVLLATVSGISQISRYDMDRWGHFWSFTSLSARRLVEERFGPGNVVVESYGNVLPAASLLYGVAAQELTRSELDHHDADYEILIGIQAVKPG